MTEAASLSDAAVCERIVRANARTFAGASRLLPAEKRRGAFAVYAFCREADDIVDSPNSLGDRRLRAAALSNYARRTQQAFRATSDSAVLRELVWTVRRFELPVNTIGELLAGLARDLGPVRYRTWADLMGYCAGVASSVGEMCAAVFGVAGTDQVRQSARDSARTLGLAMQLTNILRDVGEDAGLQRCYLPDEDLDRFGVRRAEILERRNIASEERWRSLMLFEIERARSLYRSALPGVRLVASESQPCAFACMAGYALILRAIERNDFDTINRRAVAPPLSLVTALARSWLRLPPRIPPDRGSIDSFGLARGNLATDSGQ